MATTMETKTPPPEPATDIMTILRAAFDLPCPLKPLAGYLTDGIMTLRTPYENRRKAGF